MARILHIVFLFAVLSVSVLPVAADDDFVPGEVIVGLSQSEAMSISAMSAMVERCGGSVIAHTQDAVLVRVREGDEDEFIRRIMRGGVRYAERNGIVRALYTPNDPYYDRQWGPKHIYADDAWDIVKGNKDIKIAIIDTGIDYNHEDISANYVSGGYDWVNDDDDPMDDNGHGTHCAGIAAAVMDNSKGIAGVAQVSIMAEKVLNSDGYGSYWDLGCAIEHAVGKGADVISMSLGGDVYSSWLEEKCDDAYRKGAILVAAAGNEGSDVCYPAAYESVIAVGAVDWTNSRKSWSNYGEELELVAPGEYIYSTLPSNKYGAASGTSMATPFVAGVAALVWSANASLSNQDVRSILQKTAIDLGATGWDEYYGYGLVNASKSVRAAAQTSSVITGRIQYTNNETGIPGVTVALMKDGDTIANTTTDKTGRFSFEVSEGEYTIVASKPHFWSNSTVVSGNCDVNMRLWIRGDLNNNGKSADAGDVTLMLRASVLLIKPDWRYDLNENGRLADAGDVTLMLRASVGYITL